MESPWSFVDKQILKFVAPASAVLNAGGPRIGISEDAVIDVVGSLHQDVDVRWVFRKPRDLWSYESVSCYRSNATEYDIEVVPAVLNCIGVPDAAYHWEQVLLEMRTRHGLHSEHALGDVVEREGIEEDKGEEAPIEELLGDVMERDGFAAMAVQSEQPAAGASESLLAENTRLRDLVQEQAKTIRGLKRRVCFVGRRA